MKVQTKLRKSRVICEEVATLSPPAKVALPILTHKRTKPSPTSVEGLPNIAKRISKIHPTAKPRKKDGNLAARKARTPSRSPSIKPEKRPQPTVYERPIRSFD